MLIFYNILTGFEYSAAAISRCLLDLISPRVDLPHWHAKQCADMLSAGFGYSSMPNSFKVAVAAALMLAKLLYFDIVQQ